MTLDLPTPPLPEPMQITFLTWASAPSGSAARPSLRPSAVFSLSESTSKVTLTPVTPSSSRTACATPVSKWLRIGQPGVVSDTITSTTPLGWMSIDRTISSSTMSRRSSGSMTERRASVTCSLVGMDPFKQTAPGGSVGRPGIGRRQRPAVTGRGWLGSTPSRALRPPAARLVTDDREHIEVVVEQVLAHHAVHARVAQRRELLGRSLDRADDPAGRGIVQEAIRVASRRTRLGGCGRQPAGAVAQLASSAPTTNPVMTEKGSGSRPAASQASLMRPLRLGDLLEGRERRVVLVGVAGGQGSAARTGRSRP